MKDAAVIGLMSLPASWDEARLHAEWAEDIGFTSLWTGDHLRHQRQPEHPFLDGWTLLSSVVSCYERVRIGMLVSNLIYRHPALLARQAAATDLISNGRLVLGVGTGVYETDHAMAGVPPWTRSERVRRLEESLAVLDRLLRGDTVTSSGPYYPMTLLVGALGTKTRPRRSRRCELSARSSTQPAGGRGGTLRAFSGHCASTRRFDPWSSRTGLERLGRSSCHLASPRTSPTPPRLKART